MPENRHREEAVQAPQRTCLCCCMLPGAVCAEDLPSRRLGDVLLASHICELLPFQVRVQLPDGMQETHGDITSAFCIALRPWLNPA